MSSSNPRREPHQRSLFSPEDFAPYLEYRDAADRMFQRVKQEYAHLIRCRDGCNDCCFAVFELTWVEAAYISARFHETLGRTDRREVLRKAEKSDALLRQAVGEARRASPSNIGSALAKVRVECPLHFRGRCRLYSERPITCRVYGIPCAVQGAGVTCGRSGFEPGASYPTVDLDRLQERLIQISHALASQKNAAVPPYPLVSLGRALRNRVHESFGVRIS